MPEWSSPAWLAGLLLAPGLWMLHKWRFRHPETPVSAGFLWRSTDSGETSGERWREADPAWRRRALLAVLLSLAAAGPRWESPSRREIEIWVDDSLSMLAQEGATPRHRLAWRVLEQALNAAGPYRATLRSLSRPARTLRFEAGALADTSKRLAEWYQAPASELMPPRPEVMNPAADHWLLTDGADSSLNAWAASAPILRLLQIGQSAENWAVTSLTWRAGAKEGAPPAGLIAVANAGESPGRRSLELFLEQQPIQRWALDLAPGETRWLPFEPPTDGGSWLSARLSPADPLVADDSLRLAPFRRIAARLLGICGNPLRAALLTHPALDFEAQEFSADARIHFACGEEAILEGAGIHFHRSATAVQPATSPLWNPLAGPLRRIFLDRSWLRVFPTPPPGEADVEKLLEANHQPLILERNHPTRLDLYLDLETEEFTGRPEFPGLLAMLIERVVPSASLDSGPKSARPVKESRIAPLPLLTRFGTPLVTVQTPPPSGGRLGGGEIANPSNIKILPPPDPLPPGGGVNGCSRSRNPRPAPICDLTSFWRDWPSSPGICSASSVPAAPILPNRRPHEPFRFACRRLSAHAPGRSIAGRPERPRDPLERNPPLDMHPAGRLRQHGERNRPPLAQAGR